MAFIEGLNKYWVYCVTDLEPAEVGLDVKRPRIYVCGVLKSDTELTTQEEFKNHVMTFVKEVKVRVAKKRGPIGIVRALEKHMDLVKPSLPAAGEYTKCKCVLKSTCADHWCKCKMCSNMKVAGALCMWRARHHKAWQALEKKRGEDCPSLDFFHLHFKGGRDVNSLTTSHRERDLLNLYLNEQAYARGIDTNRKDLTIETILGTDAVP